LEFNAPFQHKYGYIRDGHVKSRTGKKGGVVIYISSELSDSVLVVGKDKFTIGVKYRPSINQDVQSLTCPFKNFWISSQALMVTKYYFLVTLI